MRVNEIKDFLLGFINKENSLIDLKIQHDIPAIKKLLGDYVLTEAYCNKLLEDEAPKFNLFSILNIYHLESRVHTPFLVELLNPEGRHGQGRLFINAFLIYLFSGNVNLKDITDITVKKEFSDYKNGRMDILIGYYEKGLPKEIVVENKIYHHDEKQQLTRYHKYLTETKKLKEGQFHLIYLTPYKSKPTEESINKELYETLTKANALREWSYYEDVDLILKSTLNQIKAPVVKESIIQYINAIQFL